MPSISVVSALLKVEILKANHNGNSKVASKVLVVSALLKVEILKANHNSSKSMSLQTYVVSALLKVEILKANHKVTICDENRKVNKIKENLRLRGDDIQLESSPPKKILLTFLT